MVEDHVRQRRHLIECEFVDHVKLRGGAVERWHGRELKGAGGDVRHTRGDAICLYGRTFVECVSVDELDGGREEVVDSRKGRAIAECVFPDGFQPVVELDVDERRAAIERVARNPDERGWGNEVRDVGVSAEHGPLEFDQFVAVLDADREVEVQRVRVATIRPFVDVELLVRSANDLDTLHDILESRRISPRQRPLRLSGWRRHVCPAVRSRGSIEADGKKE